MQLDQKAREAAHKAYEKGDGDLRILRLSDARMDKIITAYLSALPAPAWEKAVEAGAAILPTIWPGGFEDQSEMPLTYRPDEFARRTVERILRAASSFLPVQGVGGSNLHIVFTGFPGPGNECVFVEVENDAGKSISAGEWKNRPDGLVELVIPAALSAIPAQSQEPASSEDEFFYDPRTGRVAGASQEPPTDLDIAIVIGGEVRRRNRVGQDDERGSISQACEHAATHLVLNALADCGYTISPARPAPEGWRPISELPQDTDNTYLIVVEQQDEVYNKGNRWVDKGYVCPADGSEWTDDAGRPIERGGWKVILFQPWPSAPLPEEA